MFVYSEFVCSSSHRHDDAAIALLAQSESSAAAGPACATLHRWGPNHTTVPCITKLAKNYACYNVDVLRLARDGTRRRCSRL